MMMRAEEKNPNFILKEPSLVKKLHKTWKSNGFSPFGRPGKNSIYSVSAKGNKSTNIILKQQQQKKEPQVVDVVHIQINTPIGSWEIRSIRSKDVEDLEEITKHSAEVFVPVLLIVSVIRH